MILHIDFKEIESRIYIKLENLLKISSSKKNGPKNSSVCISSPRPLRQMVFAGRMGIRSGKGCYDYDKK